MFLNSTTFILFKPTRHTSSASTPVQCTPAPLYTGATHEVQTYGVPSSTTNCLHSTTITQHYTTHTMKLQQDQHEGWPQQHDSWHSTVGDTTRRSEGACASATTTPPTPSNWLLLVHPNKRSQLHCRVIVYCILCWREPITRLVFESLFNHFGYNCSGVDHFHLFQWFYNISFNTFKCWLMILLFTQWLPLKKGFEKR